MANWTAYYLSRVPKLRKSGAEWRCACPIHKGKRDSFSVNMETGLWRCHSECDEGGDAYKLEMRLLNVNFPEAKRSVDEMSGQVQEQSKNIKQFGRIIATYDYKDENGVLVYQVCRYDPKSFRQRRPNPESRDGWDWSLGKIDRILYRLPDLLVAQDPVLIVEGEKDVDLLRSWGFNATCNSGGAGKFTQEMANHLKERKVVIIPDQDDKGIHHGKEVASKAKFAGADVYILDIDAKDVSDWAAENGGDVSKFQALIDGAAPYGKKVKKIEADPHSEGIPANVYEMQQNYIILVGSDMIWDVRRARTVSQAEVKLAHAAEYTQWLKDPATKRIDIERLVFKPQGCPEHEINTYKGLTIKQNANSPCVRIISHLSLMCGGDPALTHWVTAWLAYPLQNAGAKMKTALVVFGGQGTGKSLLFEAVAKIYGEYASIVGQTQIDSVYTGWASRKLFVIADEVLSQRDARVIKNRLKSLITGDQIIIEEKYRQARTEQNSMNLVFLSNENTPVVLEQDDRRFTVVEFQNKQSKDYYEALAKEIENGGVNGFMHYLLNYDLAGFNSHTPPYDTAARAELIDVSLDPQDKFFDMWEVGELPVPLCSAATTDLYEAFRVWCTEAGEKWRLPTFTAFSRSVGKRYPNRKQLSLSDGRRATVISPDGSEVVSASAMAFRERLTSWLDSVKARKVN